ncbi:hypothetical protein SMALA_4165 [Streptomyces malaysiensis subsp. malaysiensis]|nr:hypothetical protein SMALA_4165 [Streptomyces malaysiensis]
MTRDRAGAREAAAQAVRLSRAADRAPGPDRPASLLTSHSLRPLIRLSRSVTLGLVGRWDTPAATLRDPESVLQRFDQTVREVAELSGVRLPVAEHQAGVTDEFSAHPELDRFHFVSQLRQVAPALRIGDQMRDRATAADGDVRSQRHLLHAVPDSRTSCTLTLLHSVDHAPGPPATVAGVFFWIIAL